MTDLVLIAVGIGLILVLLLWAGRKHARLLQRTRKIRIDRFKLKRRHADIRLEVFGSSMVVDAIRAYAKEHHVSIETADRQAHIYLAEIVPKFNLLAYYRFGAPLARALLFLFYRVIVDRKTIQNFNDTLPKGSVVVYVINHRSNADYVLVAYMLFRFISLSYAVGEWARVWPLNHLFKWFGAYFVRRRYREPLYHAVLRRFVQTITENGVTQGIFIEGGLSRDGAFQKPKLGMLDYIVSAKRSERFQAPLYLVPTSLNFDRVLEDRNLTEELIGKEDRRSRIEKLSTSFEFLFKNLWRSVRRRMKRYGYAIVSFGAPILVDDFIVANPAILEEEYERKKPALVALGDLVMERISQALPVTPVAVVARAFLRAGEPRVSEEMLLVRIEEEIEWLRDRVWLIPERTAGELWESARKVLEMRRLVDSIDGSWQWAEDESLLREYYANSLETWPEVKRRGGWV